MLISLGAVMFEGQASYIECNINQHSFFIMKFYRIYACVVVVVLMFSAMDAAGQEVNDSILARWERELELNEVVVVARQPVMKQQPDKIVYLTKNDPYAVGLNGVQVLDTYRVYPSLMTWCRWLESRRCGISLTGICLRCPMMR